jgi:hypothetical protein
VKLGDGGGAEQCFRADGPSNSRRGGPPGFFRALQASWACSASDGDRGKVPASWSRTGPWQARRRSVEATRPSATGAKRSQALQQDGSASRPTTKAFLHWLIAHRREASIASTQNVRIGCHARIVRPCPIGGDARARQATRNAARVSKRRPTTGLPPRPWERGTL